MPCLACSALTASFAAILLTPSYLCPPGGAAQPPTKLTPVPAAAASSAEASVDAPHPASNPACQPVTNIQSALGLLQSPSSQTWLVLDPVILIVQLVILRAICFYALKWKTKPSTKA